MSLSCFFMFRIFGKLSKKLLPQFYNVVQFEQRAVANTIKLLVACIYKFRTIFNIT